MAICKNCGTSFDSFYNLCPKCGTRYDPSENMAAPIVSPPETMPFFPDTPPPYLSENQNHPAKSKKTKTILIISIIAACILVIGAAAVIILINTLNHHTQYSDQLSLGEKYLSVENYDEAIKALKKAIEIDPNNPEPYLLLADAYIGKGDYANALAVLQQGYEITADPDIKKKLSVVRVLSDTFEQSSDSVSSESSLQESSVQESSQPVSSQSESSDESSVPDILATVYFRAPEYWKDAYAHVYDENHTYNDDSGIAMTLIDPDTHLYECIILNDISYNNPLIVFTTKTEGLRASRRSFPKSGGFEMEDGKTYVHDSYEEKSSSQESSRQESSDQESSKQASALTSITITSNPTKTNYYIGDSLDLSGLVVRANYSDGSTATVTSQCTASGFSSSTTGTKTVTLTYNDKKATFKVTVSKKPEESSQPSSSGNIIETGKCGDNITYTLDDTGLLIISGTGEIADTGTHGNFYLIDENPFNYYAKKIIKKVIISPGITSIGANTFYGNSNIKEVYLPNTLKNISKGAFQGCKGLTTISIPDGVVEIGNSAFHSCENLESVTISNTVTGIATLAFARCNKLKSITIPINVSKFGSDVFLQWTSSQTIYIEGRSSAPSSWGSKWNGYCSAKIVWNA